MKATHLKRVLSLIFCMVLITAMAFITTSCNDNQPVIANDNQPVIASENVIIKCECAKQFIFNVVDYEGNVTTFEIHTDKETVGDALLELKLISGEEGPYGLYVKEVNGITADYDKDHAYWNFLIDNEVSNYGVDATKIEEGKEYSFKVTKA